MKPTVIILVALAAALPASHAHPPAVSAPLFEFSYADDSRAADSLPDVRQCGYYLLIGGTIGHSGGFRPGALVELRGDTLAAVVDLYRAYDFDQQDFRVAAWTLRVGALGPHLYHVTVAVGGKVLTRREAKLSFRSESCAD